MKEEQAHSEVDLQATALSYDINLDEDLEDAPDSEVEAIEAELVDHATAAKTVAQLADEIETLRGLERQARQVRDSGMDSKWLQMLSLLQDTPEMKNPDGTARKLVIFTEHRDTLDYLTDKLNTVMPVVRKTVVTIHGGTRREERRKTEEDLPRTMPKYRSWWPPTPPAKASTCRAPT